MVPVRGRIDLTTKNGRNLVFSICIRGNKMCRISPPFMKDSV